VRIVAEPYYEVAAGARVKPERGWPKDDLATTLQKNGQAIRQINVRPLPRSPFGWSRQSDQLDSIPSRVPLFLALDHNQSVPKETQPIGRLYQQLHSRPQRQSETSTSPNHEPRNHPARTDSHRHGEGCRSK
jgi:hypothetical protein